MSTCPHCASALGDLDRVMDELAKDNLKGEYFFTPKCCGRQVRAFSEVGMYYIAANTDPAAKPQLIGAA